MGGRGGGGGGRGRETHDGVKIDLEEGLGLFAETLTCLMFDASTSGNLVSPNNSEEASERASLACLRVSLAGLGYKIK